jgi:transposase
MSHEIEEHHMKFVQSLSQEEVNQLKALMKKSTIFRMRQRAHAILLSAKGYKMNALADIFDVDRDTISQWLTHWENTGMAGLADREKPGRPPKLSQQEEEQAFKIILESPQQVKAAIPKIHEQFGKEVSRDWIKRLLKKKEYLWKRIRQSYRPQREEDDGEHAFHTAQQELVALQEQDKAGEIDLYYFDESGFSLTSVIPYAWQPVNVHILVVPVKSKRINILGFFKRDNTLIPYMIEGIVDSEVTIACFDNFCTTLTKETVVVLDNASIHTSEQFQEKIPIWKTQGLTRKFLPKHSPELNLIEILWKHIKYYWLPFSAYLSFECLKEAVTNILIKIGKDYRVSFA